jgi:hypothetical protein
VHQAVEVPEWNSQAVFILDEVWGGEKTRIEKEGVLHFQNQKH